MYVQIGCALLAGAAAMGLVLLFSRIDPELPAPKSWVWPIIGTVTAGAGFVLAYRTAELYPIIACLFLSYLAFTVYTDASIRRVYTLVNIVALAGMIAFYGIRQWGNFAWTVPIAAVIFFGLGLIGAYGKGDGYALAAMTLYVGAIGNDRFSGMMYMVIIGCGCFVLYSIVDYLLGRIRKRERSAVGFWKEKRPLLPSMSVGLVAALLIVG